MSKQHSSPKPALSIDMKHNLIRIHKVTLNTLGNPDYIQLLVNPDDRSIAITTGISKDKLAHHVCYDKIKRGQSFELHSTILLQNLLSISEQCETMKAYRIYGKYVPEHNIIRFPIEECVLYGAERIKNE